MTNKWVWNGFNEWRIGTEFLQLDVYEDCDQCDPDKCECTEVWVMDDKTGNFDVEGIFDTYEKAKQYALKFMKENPYGWMLKDSIKAEKEKTEKVLFT